MAVRRIAEEQPENFAFTPENSAWAKLLIDRYPEGKQASAVIPLLWRAQEQNNGWLPEPAMRKVAEILDMPYIRVMEVATFYTMFQLKPVGSVAHIQVCGTTPCMLRGSDDLIDICKKRISKNQFEITADGKFSWEEVECLGACVNAPMVQVFKDTFEDLTAETFEKMLDDMDAGHKVKPGPQASRHLSVNSAGRSQLFDVSMNYGEKADPYIAPYIMAGNATLIDNDARSYGTKSSVTHDDAVKARKQGKVTKKEVKSTTKKDVDEKGMTSKAALQKPTTQELEKEETETQAKLSALPKGASAEEKANAVGKKPRGLVKPRKEGADDLKLIKGVGKVIEGKLNDQGIWHFNQIAKWDRPEIIWFDTFLSFKGRIDRDGWIEQANILAEGGETEFSNRASKTAKKAD